jgi:hypothetical protein
MAWVDHVDRSRAEWVILFGRARQRFEAEVGLKRVGDAPGPNFSAEPVHAFEGNRLTVTES